MILVAAAPGDVALVFIELGFPHNLFVKDMVRSLSYGGMWDRIDAR